MKIALVLLLLELRDCPLKREAVDSLTMVLNFLHNRFLALPRRLALQRG